MGAKSHDVTTAVRRLVVACAAMLNWTLPCHAAVIFSNDFETNTNGFSAGGQHVMFNGVSDSNFLGFFSASNPSSTNLSLSAMQVGNTYSLAFDLFAANTLDGSNSNHGPDFFIVTAGSTVGSTKLLNATFSNIEGPNFPQSYSDATPLGGGLFDPQSGADVVVPPGSIYRFDGVGPNPIFLFYATKSDMTVSFVARTTSGYDDEFFALDNVVVRDLGVVLDPPTNLDPPIGGTAPEPGTLALLCLAIAGLAASHRRIR